MTTAQRILAVASLLLLGFALRCVSVRDVRLDAEAAARTGSRWLLDDPATCCHLRRVELALAAGRTPQSDAFLEFPARAEIAWPPLFDTVLAVVADRALAQARGDPALGGVEESDLEDLLVWVSPCLALLAACALYWAMRELVRGPRRDVLALFAVALFAVAPVAVAQGGFGRLDHLSFATLFFALQAGLTLRVLRAREPFDVVLGSMLLGLVAGLSLATFSLAIFFFAASWVALVAFAYWGERSARALGQRAGLLFCIVAVIVGQISEMNGPWESAAGWLQRANQTSTELVLFSSAPFMAAFLLPGRQHGRGFQTMAFLVVLGMLVYFSPSLAERVIAIAGESRQGVEGVACASPEFRSLAAAVAHDGSWRWSIAATPLALAIVPLVVALLRRWREPRALFVAMLAAAALALGLYQVRCLVFVVFAVPLVLGSLVDGLEEPSAGGTKLARKVAIAFVALVICAHAIAPALAPFDEARHAARGEWVQGLRWMRASTPSPGAWNASVSQPEWGVLADPSSAHLVQYHARRPTLVSELGLVSARHAESWWTCALESESFDRLSRELVHRRGRYVIVGPHMLAADAPSCACDGTAQSTRARYSHASLLWRLAMTPTDDESQPFPELTRVYASTRRITSDGHPPKSGEDSGPVISIYSVAADLVESPRAEINAR